jgi:sugar phosphate isomerase/epimerase
MEDAGADMIRYLAERTALLATRIGLYNHGDWFGNPVNQLKIIQVLNDPGIGIVYNFHHAHAQIDRFPSLMSVMKPHLLAVNIDGMRRSGPQILTVGSGDEEKAMLQELLMSGYTGPIGILGHIETEDVEVVLKRNLDGLRKLVKILSTKCTLVTCLGSVKFAQSFMGNCARLFSAQPGRAEKCGDLR